MAPVFSTLPAGEYKVVTVALDLTGKKVIDEICQVGAYSHPETFSQYVMPFRDVSPSSIRDYGIRIVTTYGRYRVLKDATSMMTLKTKSEYSALCDFIQWLKEINAVAKADGIILAYHDNNREGVPSFLFEALNRYKLANDFFDIIVGFLNVEKLAKEISEEPESELKGMNLTLRSLTSQLLTKGKGKAPMQSAVNRAAYTYMVLQHLTKSEETIAVSDQIMGLCTTHNDALQSLAQQQLLSQKIGTLKPLFAAQMRKSAKDRSRAAVLRRHLIDSEIVYTMLQQAYEERSGSGESVLAIISKTSANEKKKDMDDLMEIIMNHFKRGGKGKKVEVGQGEPAIAITAVSNESGTSASSIEADDEQVHDAIEK